MRIVFIDMHCINFLTNTYDQIIGGTKVKTYKHKFIVDYALGQGIPVINFVTKTATTDKWIGYKEKIIKITGTRLLDNNLSKGYMKEAKFVTDYSYGSNCGIGIISDVSEIRKDDFIVAYLLDERQRKEVSKINVGHKILMGNHFVAINEPYDLHAADIEAFVNEVDLSDNVFVNKYLNNVGVKNIICPYVFADRFKNIGAKRKNRAMAVGTLSTCKGNSGYKLYREFFGTEWIQLMRKEIYDHADEYPDQIDSYISYIFEDKKEIEPEDSKIVKLYKKFYNKHTGWTQSKYTSFDMVEKFNEYTMFVCPEELVGMPGIGFVEGMACGTAYIGLDASYYRKLGLVPGKHYITYDGTLKGLVDTIREYQKKPEEIQRIAQTGTDHIRKCFNTTTVARKFFEDLAELVN